MPDAGVQTVDRVARLAHLQLTAEEREAFASELGAILAYVESIQGLDLADVPPMSHPNDAGSFRDDTPVPGLARAEAMDAAPDAADGLFRVPRVL